jgi:hypothetical protein
MRLGFMTAREAVSCCVENFRPSIPTSDKVPQIKRGAACKLCPGATTVPDAHIPPDTGAIQPFLALSVSLLFSTSRAASLRLYKGIG